MAAKSGLRIWFRANRSVNAPPSALVPWRPAPPSASKGYLTPTVHVDRLHNINFELDYGNRIAETNENDNLHAEAPYILGKGDC